MLKSILLTAATSALLLTTAAHADAITALDPFVREVPPGSPTTAAFMTLHNTSDSPVRLINADNELTAHTEMHNHVDVDGVMQMRQIEHIDVPANGDVTLAPGGLHLMMIGLEGAVSEGDKVALTLTFDNGETLDITAPVRPIMPMSH
ncbi:copper chaperone PCu(A)C [Vreelandella salicampi]|uniref:Copper chaperone PCu(A)C n=1 Tax=Vreelandella salicampi TaxID=1449798 RepID=A0A7Z0LMT4_9GAMM|nr:copper chaperone PCu(A)C [Halomonas salicampi]NYS61775.1 copper chaperone PCu(A)C [Halomonas salicampi]